MRWRDFFAVLLLVFLQIDIGVAPVKHPFCPVCKLSSPLSLASSSLLLRALSEPQSAALGASMSQVPAVASCHLLFATIDEDALLQWILKNYC